MNGHDFTAGLKVKTMKEIGDKIDSLNTNLQKQNKLTTKLTIAMYFLAGVGILLAVIQILVANFKK